MFFTYKHLPYEWGCYSHCYLTCDIGPFKKGEYFREIYRFERTNVFRLCQNYYEFSYNLDLTKFLRVHSSARRIQRAWRRCISDPSYTVCKKRLLREYYNVEPKTVDIDHAVSENWLNYIYNFELVGPVICDPYLISMRQRIKEAKERIPYEEYYEQEQEQEFAVPIEKRKFFVL